MKDLPEPVDNRLPQPGKWIPLEPEPSEQDRPTKPGEQYPIVNASSMASARR
jgi:hypothetical protein